MRNSQAWTKSQSFRGGAYPQPFLQKPWGDSNCGQDQGAEESTQGEHLGVTEDLAAGEAKADMQPLLLGTGTWKPESAPRNQVTECLRGQVTGTQ